MDEKVDSAVWDDPFFTEEEAFQDFQHTLEEEGIESMIGLDQWR